jgi:hypothetical protein
MKTFQTIIKESFLTGFNSSNGYTEIYVNPSRSEIRGELDNAYRFIIDIENKNIYAWVQYVPHSEVLRLPDFPIHILSTRDSIVSNLDKYLLGDCNDGIVDLGTLYDIKEEGKHNKILRVKLEILKNKSWSWLKPYGIQDYELLTILDDLSE